MSAPLDARPRVRVPSTARPGEIIEIRALLEHPMQTGLHADRSGRPIPRDKLAEFVAEARDGASSVPVFRAVFGNGASANPAFTFFARVEATTEFVFTWRHEDGRSVSASARVRVG